MEGVIEDTYLRDAAWRDQMAKLDRKESRLTSEMNRYDRVLNQTQNHLREQKITCWGCILSHLPSPIRAVAARVSDEAYQVRTVLHHYEGKKYEAQAKIKEISTQLLEISREKMALDRKYRVVIKSQIGRSHPDSVMELIMELCGGRDKFLKLPYLNLDKSMGAVHPYELDGPVVRGKDRHNRPFIAIRAQVEGDPEQQKVVQFFYQKFPMQGSWIPRGYPIINPPGFLIDKGVLNTKYYEELKELLEKGSAHTSNIAGHKQNFAFRLV